MGLGGATERSAGTGRSPPPCVSRGCDPIVDRGAKRERRPARGGVGRASRPHHPGRPRRKGIDDAAGYLTAKMQFLHYDQALASGWPPTGGSTAPQPSSSTAPCAPTATSTPTGPGTDNKGTPATTRPATGTSSYPRSDAASSTGVGASFALQYVRISLLAGTKSPPNATSQRSKNYSIPGVSHATAEPSSQANGTLNWICTHSRSTPNAPTTAVGLRQQAFDKAWPCEARRSVSLMAGPSRRQQSRRDLPAACQ